MSASWSVVLRRPLLPCLIHLLECGLVSFCFVLKVARGSLQTCRLDNRRCADVGVWQEIFERKYFLGKNKTEPALFADWPQNRHFVIQTVP